MKKYLMISLVIAILLTGCSQNKKDNPTESAEVPSKKEIFAKFVDEEDLESYILKVNEVIENEEDYFISETIISSNNILESLENYCELMESEDTYVVELESGPDDINEIKNILFGREECNSSFEELTSLKARYYFKKDNYYPISFKWEAKFLNKDNNEVTEIKQTGSYEKVNILESVEIPEEIKSLLNSSL